LSHGDETNRNNIHSLPDAVVAAGSKNVIAKNEPVLSAGRLQLRFAFRNDRFAHEIWAADGDDWRPVMSSVEGTPEQSWPPSAPLQTLHVEARSEGPIALLVGMAGKCHWSASVELHAQRHQVRFELAARVRPPGSPWLGSTYQLAEGYRAVPVHGDRIELSASGGMHPGIAVQAAESGTLVELSNQDSVLIAAREILVADTAATIRWSYRLELSSPRP
jgi:hypothetical protein